ncbi:MAG: phosphate ABC transporter permease PstA [Acidimicrobiaceae bacterium]|nr:phosphate ABC transporter permease PstA [Acidimicrobiaceae bacterium]
MAIIDDVGRGTGWRRKKALGFRALTYVSLIFVVGPALLLMFNVASQAIPHWSWSVLTTVPLGNGGGLENAILGTLVIMLGVLLLGGTTGVLAGIFLAEFVSVNSKGKERGGILRASIDVLAGFPSIVLGYVGYVALAVGLHWGFSLLGALIVLSLMVVPYITKATETALRQVPTNYREGAEALGMRMGYGLRKVTLRTALPGIVTGLLLAESITVGETAPLLYTAGISNGLPNWQLIHQPIGYLTYYVWTDWNQPFPSLHYLSYDASLILLVMIFTLLIGSRLLVTRSQRHSESGH